MVTTEGSLPPSDSGSDSPAEASAEGLPSHMPVQDSEMGHTHHGGMQVVSFVADDDQDESESSLPEHGGGAHGAPMCAGLLAVPKCGGHWPLLFRPPVSSSAI